MKNVLTVSAVALVCGSAMGGMSWPNVWGPMEHVEVSLNNGAVHVHVGTDAANPVELHRFAGETYDGSASVLDDSYYSSQYGWVADGFISLNPGEFMWVEHVSSTAGLDVYEGGMRMMRDMHSYDAILGTDGSDDAWMWSGMMVHNWYSADAMGVYEATYEVFVGDADGNAVAGYTSGIVTLNFNAVPSPAGVSLLGLGGLAAARRKRGGS